jgi:hypothetical protein
MRLSDLVETLAEEIPTDLYKKALSPTGRNTAKPEIGRLHDHQTRSLNATSFVVTHRKKTLLRGANFYGLAVCQELAVNHTAVTSLAGG